MDEPDPARIVADADVLAADLLRDGDARDALDVVRAHSWLSLVASDPLLADARAIIAQLADPSLADDWREHIDELRVRVGHSIRGSPGARLGGSGRRRPPALVRRVAPHGRDRRPHPRARRHERQASRRVLWVVRPETLYPTIVDGDYPGPDRDPRA